jgi:CubicO group peptidase (beta-lactamase class C family)
MAAHPSRRSVLGLLGLVPVAASTAIMPGPSVAASTGTFGNGIPDGVRPGGELDQFVAASAAADQFSGSLLLTHRGRTVLARSHGMADRQRAVHNGPDTRFGLASVTKLFTAVAIAKLVAQGKVRYQERLGTYLDGFPDPIAGVTVHHLLTHTSGLGDYHGMPGFWEAAATWTTPDGVMAGITEFITRSPVAFPAGARWTYSNSGFHLLGEIVAKVSGVSYYEYVRRDVFGPAGMSGADFITTTHWRSDRRFAHPYHRDEQGQWVDAIGEFPYVGSPAGDAFTTCADLARFARHLYRDRFLEPGYTKLVLSGKLPMPWQAPPPGQTPPSQTGTPAQAIYQCYGPIGTLAGGQWNFGHGGGNSSGMSTAVEFYPETDWVLVVLSNQTDSAVQPIVGLARRLIVTA